jgi:hypothetical protein
MATFRVATMLCLIVVASLISGCGLISSPQRTDQICDGIPADAGGCDNPPVYVGTTCEALGAEWGKHVNDRLLEIIDGPIAVDGARQSSRILAFQILATVRLARHLDRIGLLGGCSAADILSGADKEFSAELRDSIGGVLYDGEPVATWEEFEASAAKALGVLDFPVSS